MLPPAKIFSLMSSISVSFHFFNIDVAINNFTDASFPPNGSPTPVVVCFYRDWETILFTAKTYEPFPPRFAITPKSEAITFVKMVLL